MGKSFVKSGIWYVLVNYIGTFISVTSSLILRLFLPAKIFGAISIVTGIQNYFEMVNMVFRNAIDREVPYYKAKNKEHLANLLTDVSFTTLILLLSIQSLLLIAFGFFADTDLLRIGWIAMGLSLPFLSLGTTYKILLKSQFNLKAHNRAYLLASIIGNTTLVLMSIAISDWGYFIGYFASAVIQFLIFKLEYKFRFLLFVKKSKLLKRMFFRIIRVGSTIAMLSLTSQLIITIDRYFIVGVFGLEELGAYSLAGMVMSKVYDLPRMAAGIYMPKLMGSVAKKDHQTILTQNGDMKLLLVSVAVLLATFVNVILRDLIVSFVPEYLDYINFIKILLIGSVVWTFYSLSQQLNIAFKNTFNVLIYNLVILALVIAAFFMLNHYKVSLIYYSITTLSGMFAIALVAYTFELKLLHASFTKDIRVIFTVFLFIGFAVLSIYDTSLYFRVVFPVCIVVFTGLNVYKVSLKYKLK